MEFRSASRQNRKSIHTDELHVVCNRFVDATGMRFFAKVKFLNLFPIRFVEYTLLIQFQSCFNANGCRHLVVCSSKLTQNYKTIIKLIKCFVYATNATGSSHWSWFRRIQPIWLPFSPSNAWTRQSRVPKIWRSKRKFVTVYWAVGRPHHFSEIPISQHISVCGHLWRVHGLRYSRAAISRVSNVWLAEKAATLFWWNPHRLNMWLSVTVNWHKSAIYLIRRAMVLRCAKVSLRFNHLYYLRANIQIYTFFAPETDSPYRTAISGSVLKLQEEGKLHILKTRWWKEKRIGGRSCKVNQSSICIENKNYVIFFSPLHYNRMILQNRIQSRMSLD